MTALSTAIRELSREALEAEYFKLFDENKRLREALKLYEVKPIGTGFAIAPLPEPPKE